MYAHTHSSLKVTSLAAYKSSQRVSGKPHKVSKLVQIVDKATQNFVAVGEEIASENPEFQVWLPLFLASYHADLHPPNLLLPYILQVLKNWVEERACDKANSKVGKYACTHSHMHEQSVNHISPKKINRSRCYAKSPTVQDTHGYAPNPCIGVQVIFRCHVATARETPVIKSNFKKSRSTIYMHT